MSRLTPLDKALVLILVPLWLVCLGLHLQVGLQDRLFFSFEVSSAQDAAVAIRVSSVM